ncbi:unnamed protein product [Enterobius vermicularis]|uniref:N-acetylglucosaminylphosphatidylinositol deacetylase n=1 Tax=Enterobius vermicularis TaxID=51028 RepID=A0A0N4UYU7_ENTVE|nr:unnamed protein product [Enterobius vermicularis]
MIVLILFFILIFRVVRKNTLHAPFFLTIFAHPDDETMFFAPTLNGLRQSDTSVYFLCISTGNQNGFGKLRKTELAQAIQIHGFSVDNLTILDYDSFKDGFFVWCKEELAKAALKYIEMLEIDVVITFDEDGVSLHPNHASCFRALQYLYSNGLLPAGVQVFVLESVPIWRKYFLPLDAVVSAFHSTFLYVSPPSAYFVAWRAMFAHSSQLVWFRYLYMIFSRYIHINTLKRIHLQPRYYVRKKLK